MNTIYVIAQQDLLTIGHNETRIVHTLASQSMYGGHMLPCFSNKEQAEKYLIDRPDAKYRRLHIVKLTVAE